MSAGGALAVPVIDQHRSIVDVVRNLGLVERTTLGCARQGGTVGEERNWRRRRDR